ncbi:sulfotransferase domain-containing protein [Cobetia amphilecti]|uniref:sulfotransferase domain-containing protein n=1 Tax=Cobetia amphilecti TaxID=1055104 RepID=UPI0012EB7283|nr:sulfotransferase domain-containing protein [Cobetia amphilecti]
MKHLIIPGLAKAGTTFLYDYLSNHGNDIFNKPVRKETRYFSKNRDLEGIEDYYPDASIRKIYLDATPSYLSSPNSGKIISNIETALLGKDVYFVICLRNYFDRIVSHYLHDLKGAYKNSNKWSWNQGDYTLYSKRAIDKYFSSYANECRTLVDKFGHERVLGLSTKDTYSEKSINSINAMLDVELPLGDFTQISNPGGWLPKLIYGGDKGIEFHDGQHLIFVPAYTLLCVNNNRSWIRYNVSSNEGLNAVKYSAAWSSTFENTGPLFHKAKEDYMKACDILKVEPELPDKDYIIATRPSLSNKIIKHLACS